MIEILKQNDIEIKKYSSDCTLKELTKEIEKIESDHIKCNRCGDCCHDNVPILGIDIIKLMRYLKLKNINKDLQFLNYPRKPHLNHRKKSLKELSQLFGLSEFEAAIFYEYNNSEPVVLCKNDKGKCIFHNNSGCSIYKIRPYICRLYHCKCGEKLSYLKEMIVSQGTWHAYYVLDWIDKEEIKHNPFLTGNTYSDILLKPFDYNIESIQHKLSVLF